MMKTTIHTRLAMLAAMLLLLLAGSHSGASQQPRLDEFQLRNEKGQATRIAPSPQATLVYFYRGDW